MFFRAGCLLWLSGFGGLRGGGFRGWGEGFGLGFRGTRINEDVTMISGFKPRSRSPEPRFPFLPHLKAKALNCPKQRPEMPDTKSHHRRWWGRPVSNSQSGVGMTVALNPKLSILSPKPYIPETPNLSTPFNLHRVGRRFWSTTPGEPGESGLDPSGLQKSSSSFSCLESEGFSSKNFTYPPQKPRNLKPVKGLRTLKLIRTG